MFPNTIIDIVEATEFWHWHWNERKVELLYCNDKNTDSRQYTNYNWNKLIRAKKLNGSCALNCIEAESGESKPESGESKQIQLYSMRKAQRKSYILNKT